MDPTPPTRRPATPGGPTVSPPADSAAIRRRNLGLVLRHLADHGPCPRTEVAAATGLAHGSVTALVADLADRGLIAEDDAQRSGVRGRPGRPLRLEPGRAAVAAIQVTSEQLRVAVSDLAGVITWRDTVAHDLAPGTPAAMAAAIASRIARAAATLPESGPAPVLARAVIAMAGPVLDDPDQTVVVAPDFGWLDSVPLRDLIAAHLPPPAVAIDVINDANAAALAEFHALPRDSRGLVLIEAGTGIGGGVVLDGRIHTGSHGVAGEPGHLPVAMTGPDCVCGARGCLVTFAGPEAVLDSAGLTSLLHNEGLQAARSELLSLLRQSEPQALSAMDAAATALGTAILSISALLDTDEVVLGGLLAEWFPWIAPTIENRLHGRRVLAPTLGLRIAPAVLGDDAILIGALGFARRAVLADPAVVPPLPILRVAEDSR
ncbi:ROK family transcriptional regulator [Nocardia sp. NPDC005746]|uniref:ROK family transcriptional regulator n=1 Tax=Nocardia sp. NPDC005746 TaxID=3157062 RepID=UPI0033CCAE79